MGKKSSGVDKSLLAFVSGLNESETKVLPNVKNNKEKFASFVNSSEKPEEVSLTDLTAVLGDETGFANLKKRIGDIFDAENTASAKETIAKVEIVAPPLATHEQLKLERQAAYELSVKEVNKWVPIVRANRNSKTLSFSSPQNKDIDSILTTNVVSDFQPKTSLELTIDGILKKSGIHSEDNLITAEKLEMNKLTPEEVERRYIELAKKRAHAFFAQRKTNLHAKIKSKSFRRVVKREKERSIIKEAESSGAHLDEEEMREEHMRAELNRIKERMTLKTRKASQWAHRLMQKRHMDEGSREEVMQKVRDKDRLRQEILGKAAQFQQTLSESDLDGENAEAEHFKTDDESAISAEDSASEEVKLTQSRNAKSIKKTSRQRDDYSEDEIPECSEEEETNNQIDNDVDEIFEAKASSSPSDKVVVGRRVFAPATSINKTIKESDSSTENPKPTIPIIPKDFNQDDRRKVNNATEPSLATAAGKKKAKFEKKTFADISNLFTAEEETEATLDSGTKRQLELIKKAFDGDNVFAEFEAKKQAEVDEERPKDIDLTLPGWGSWGGIGIQPKIGKIILKGRDGIDPHKRKDAGLRHVIIHERQSRKVAKLMVEKPPFPFKTADQYERSLQKPAGKEWNSTTNFTKNIKPRIQVKAGSIIQPIKFVKHDDHDLN